MKAQFVNTALINLLAQYTLADTSNGGSRWDAIDFYGAGRDKESPLNSNSWLDPKHVLCVYY